MSSSHCHGGSEQQPSPRIAPSASQPQFAHGGNSRYGEAPPERACDLKKKGQSSNSDALVMLQLASFEGRAL